MATGTSQTASTPAFHDDDSEQTSNYRSLSVLAIISLVFGIASPLVLWGPLLMAIPLLGIAISLLALRNIATSGGALAGRWAAITGLALCIASVVTPHSRDFVQRWLRAGDSEKAGRHWLTLLAEGNTEEAMRLTIDGNRGQAPAEPGAPPPKETPYQRFQNEPVVKAVTAMGAGAEITFEETLDYVPVSYRNVTLRQRFRVKSASSEARVILAIQRAQLRGENMSRWLIARYELADSPK